MRTTARETAPWIFWPIAALWDLVAFILRATGRIVGAIVGFILLVGGLLLTVSVVLAPIGIPLIVVGSLLLFRSIL